jgi:deoxyribose-phosphate aldolase
MSFDSSIARLIDHTILRPDATRTDVVQVCAEALKYQFASVCVNSCWVPLVARELRGSSVKTCTVAGFPLGAASTAAKVAETLEAVAQGATEIDMVLNVGTLKGAETDATEVDIVAVVEASRQGGAIVKVIIETALLDNDQKVLACKLAKRAGAAFVKTSTGFAKSGATVEDIALMRATVGPEMGVKASGGVRTLEDLRAMVAAGASRVGASSSVKIIEATAV